MRCASPATPARACSTWTRASSGRPDPPEQIFEHPLRQETHDFIFRVRSWEWDINTLTPDIQAMMASLVAYCQRQFMGERAAYTCQLLVEEAVVNQLLGFARRRGISDPAVHVMVTAGEGGVDTTLTIDYRAVLSADGTPSQDELDSLSMSIIEGLCDHWELVEPGLVRLYAR